MVRNNPIKPWNLQNNETIDSLEKWKTNMVSVLSLDTYYASFLVPGIKWLKYSSQNPHRGLSDDNYANAQMAGTTAKQKLGNLYAMLEFIASYCPVEIHDTIVRDSTSIEFVWQAIRNYYGFDDNEGCKLLDIGDITFKENECPEELYQRLMKCVKSNIQVNSEVNQCGIVANRSESLSQTVESLIVLMWLNLIDKDLPQLVKRRFKTALRTHTLASLKPSISQAMYMLRDELKFSRVAHKMLATSSVVPLRPAIKSITAGCNFCKKTTSPHLQRICRYLDEKRRKKSFSPSKLLEDVRKGQKKFGNKQVRLVEDNPAQKAIVPNATEVDFDQGTSGSVTIKQSPFFHAYYKHHPLKVTIDSGAETNMIKERVAQEIGAKITETNQLATQADGQSPLSIKGEIRIILKRNMKRFFLEALVVENIDVDVLAGVPFMASNDISVRPAKHQIIMGDGTVYEYGAVTLNVDSTFKRSNSSAANHYETASKRVEKLTKRLEELKN